mmetsp:Transcript_45232/g.119833  ORF Transcript_45232/g.119833 Transcript_45232/m.119833 type:complete len:341 (+) Transcript_45232:319-1341(+)
MVTAAPNHTLGAEHAPRSDALLHQAAQSTRVEWALSRVDEAGYAVLLRLGRVVRSSALQFLNPPWKHLDLLLVEAAGAQNRRRARDTELGLDHMRARVELLQYGLQRVQLLRGDQVDLVEDQDIRGLDLVDEQVDDGSLVPLLRAQLLPVFELAATLVVLQEVQAIDNCDQGVQSGNAADPRVAHVVSSSEGARHWQRLGDARALDEQIVEAPLERQLLDAIHEVLPQSAADAAVLQLDHLVLVLMQLHAVLQQLPVDVDGSHVIDKDCDALALTIVQDVREERRLPRTQKSTQQGDWQLLLLAQSDKFSPLLPRNAIDRDVQLRNIAPRGVWRPVHARP